MTKKFLIIGNRGGFYHLRAQRDTKEEASALASMLAAGGARYNACQMTYLVAEVLEAHKMPVSYNPKRTKEPK